jgi:SAM-dependent methyltransferase
MAEADRAKWDAKYAGAAYVFGSQPRSVLLHWGGSPKSRSRVSQLTSQLENGDPASRALDVACGEGQNAVWLAERGFDVCGVDISTVALHKARALAVSRGVQVDFHEADLDGFVPQGTYELIVCAHYLDRALFPRLEAALEPGGIFIGEWPTTLRSYPVAADEPPRWFPRLHVLLHRAESGIVQLIAEDRRFQVDG